MKAQKHMGHVKKLHTVTSDMFYDIIANTRAERAIKSSREERIALRISPETLDAINAIADTLSLKHSTTRRILLPDVVKIAVDTLNRVVNDAGPVIYEQ